MYLSKKFCAQETNNIANAHKSFFVIVMSKLPMAFTDLTHPFLASLSLNQNAKVIFLRPLLKIHLQLRPLGLTGTSEVDSKV